MEQELPHEHSTQPRWDERGLHLGLCSTRLCCWCHLELELGCLFVCAEGLAAKPSCVGWPPNWGWHRAVRLGLACQWASDNG